ncbi:MAG: hypothetical protein JW967_11570 [Dehalococcoidales bacterium]|nr:hypothetical protein [Dehalococcoidales bacterium]
MNISQHKEFEELLNFPILEAIAKRRTRRIPLGYTADAGVINRDPTQTPIPLNDIEEALLCWAGAGITGAVTNEEVVGRKESQLVTSWVGRSTAYPCNIQTTRLFFTNDNGVFIYNPETITKPVEIERAADWDKITTYFKNNCRKIMDKRIQLPFQNMLGVESLNNQPSTTLFIPVVDNVELYIWRVYFSIQPNMGYQFFDDIKKRPAGLQRWIDSGRLKGPPIGLASFESNQRTIYLAPAYLMVQNMQLLAEAMGLGSMIFAGFTGEIMLGITPMAGGLGFNTVKDNEGNLNPVGLDNVFEAYCPPYYKNIDEAVDSFFEKIGNIHSPIGPEYGGIVPFVPEYWQKNKPKYSRPLDEDIAIVKAFCNYVYDTYGKIPATFSSKTIPIWLQVHHINNAFYEKYYSDGILTEAYKKHLRLWHRE